MEQPPEHRVTVTGRAKRTVVPDRIEWQLTVVEQHSDEGKAYARGTERANALIEALRGVVGDDGVIKTTQQSLQPAWDDRHRKRVGHVATTSVQVRVPVEGAGEVMARVMEVGADQVYGASFSISDRDAIVEELLGDAVEVARRKADRLASAAGRSLGQALRIEEDEDEYAIAAAEFAPQARMALAGGEAAPPPQVEAGEEELAASVTVVYELT